MAGIYQRQADAGYQLVVVPVGHIRAATILP